MPETLKQDLGLLDGTPQKRLYWSIISDYDFKTALCELVDNAADLWTKSDRCANLHIVLEMDTTRQSIVLTDDAGGIREEDLRLLIAPGASNNDPKAQTIGVFGVGSKRAVVALAELVCIKTRYKIKPTFQIDLSKDWFDSENWSIPHYKVSDISEGTTIVEMNKLRKPFTQQDIDELAVHFSEIYGVFLKNDQFSIRINTHFLRSTEFTQWAYPDEYPPRHCVLNVPVDEKPDVVADITAGLITNRDPSAENYGVYFYCNDRLICKEARVKPLGYYVSTEAGVPHPDSSLCRVIVKLRGSAKYMPWNSNKTDINYDHVVFTSIATKIVALVSYYSSVSRRTKEVWDEKIFPKTKGAVEEIPSEDIKDSGKINLPELPKVNRPRAEQVVSKNKKVIEAKPWTLGLVEAIVAVEIICRQKIVTKNRIALILLDSNFEIALKEFIVHRTDLFPTHTYDETKLIGLFKNRTNVIAEVKVKVPELTSTLLDKVKHYYALRNKLIHERTTAAITDNDVEDYAATVKKVLKILFKLSF